MKIARDAELRALPPGDNKHPSFAWESFNLAQSWFISFIVHLLVLAALAAVVVPIDTIRPVMSIQALVNDEDTSDEVVQFNLPETELSLPSVGIDPQPIDEAVYSDIPDPEIRLPSSFFGAYVSGQRIAFVIDRSSSMKGDKFGKACDEVLGAVHQLDATQSFFVVFFDRGILPMFGKDTPIGEMLPATRANLQLLDEWVSQLKTGSGTKPYEAVKLVMGMRPDSIFLLSDGAFNKGDKTVDYLRKPKVNGVRIHTVGFHHEDDGTLEQIALTHGGTFRFIPRSD